MNQVFPARLRRSVLALGSLLLLAPTGCDDPTGAPAAATVVVTAPAPALTAGRTLQLAADVRDAAGEPRSGRVEWRSSDPSVATVDPAGMVRGVSPGEVVVTARSGGRTGEVALTVTRIASIALDGPPGPVAAGRTFLLAAISRDTAGASLGNLPVAWSSSDTTVARVAPQPSGANQATLTTLRPGSVTITATREGMRGSATYTVVVGDYVSILTGTPTPFAEVVAVGGTRRAVASVADIDNRPVARAVAWSSSDPGVVSVDATGAFRGVAPGVATLTASAEGARSASFQVRAERGYTATVLGFDAQALNDQGQVAGVENVSSQNGRRPVLWEGGRIVWTGPTAAGVGNVVVNGRGDVAGTWTRTEGARSRGFVRMGGEVVEIAPLDGAADLRVTGINLRGQVVGYWTVPGTPLTGSAFVWEDGRLTDLGRLGGERAEANGINDRGQILATVLPQSRVLLLDGATQTDVGTGRGSYLNNNGDVVISRVADVVVRRGGQVTELVAGHRASFIPRAMNTRGELVGSYSAIDGGIYAFLWREGRLVNPRDLTVDGPDRGFSQAVAINERGQILAYANQPLLLTPLP